MYRWVAPDGQVFLLDFDNSSINSFLKVVAAHASARLWRAAAAGIYGGGLQDGVFLDESFSWRRKLKKNGQANLAALLEVFLAGGAWCNERCFSAGLLNSALCDLCGKENQSMEHLLYGCEALHENEDPAISKSQKLADMGLQLSGTPVLLVERLDAAHHRTASPSV